MRLTVALALIVLSNGGVLAWSSAPLAPLFLDIKATSLYDAGVQQGKQAAAQIQAWFASDEMKALYTFARDKGRSAFEAFKHDNSVAFPQYLDEMKGIADGAQVDLDAVWTANLISELEALMGKRASHCSDIYAVSTDGYAGGFTHGHNEDWPGPVKRLFYFVRYTALPGANFASCAGLAYPGTLIGFASTWNRYGMYLTQNSLFPREAKARGLASPFIQRDAMCGRGAGHDLASVLTAITGKNWALGASVNLVDVRAKRMANVETYEELYGVQEVTDTIGNYSHFNMYKTLQKHHLDPVEASTVHRQARVDALGPPRTRGDVIERLSDTGDTNYPLFRNMTLSTMILTGATGRLDAWCCGHAAASARAPVYSWSLLSFFADPISDRADEPSIVV